MPWCHRYIFIGYNATKLTQLLPICTASCQMFSFRMSQIKTQFFVYLLGKTLYTNSATTKGKYVSKLMTSQHKRFLSCLYM